jgi:4-hydroxybenzoate polyprenyltransferase
VIAAIAGGGALTALRLGLSMLGLQAAIGALNDVVDAPRDAGRKPGKPIPAGLVSTRAAIGVAVGAAVGGLVFAALSGPASLGLGAVILLIGFAYDLRLKGTALSWLPFAAGIPLLPVFAWLGTGRDLPDAFAVLVPAAAIAGAALAIGNALVDVERDRAAGVTSVAATLGRRAAWRVLAALYLVVVGLAAATAVARAPLALAVAGVGPATALVLVGIGWARADDPRRRERAWRLQAAGVGLLAAGWLAVTVLV